MFYKTTKIFPQKRSPPTLYGVSTFTAHENSHQSEGDIYFSSTILLPVVKVTVFFFALNS